jgi:hypothetical protein
MVDGRCAKPSDRTGSVRLEVTEFGVAPSLPPREDYELALGSQGREECSMIP